MIQSSNRHRVGRICVLSITSSLAFAAALSAGASPRGARAADSAQPTGEQWAVLIGCENYHRANKLRFTVNDVQQIGRTLHAWGNYGKDHILEMTDEAVNDRYKPLKTNVRAELPRFLKRVGPQDVLLVYFTGHGFRDSDGKMYLAPLDVDPENPAPTGIPVEWFREQIAACPADFKLLVIDACHAGSEKGDDEKSGIPASDLGNLFKNLDKVVTLASSTAEQKSQIWEDKEQSLFSYWLNQGLKGHADADGDGAVDIDELYKYVSRTVSQTAEHRFSRPQTPVRIVRSGVHDVPVLIHLQPQRLKSVLADMAEQLADALADRKAVKVGVLEFTNDTKLGELLGADFGTMGKWCTSELESQLMERGAGKFSIVDNRRLQAALTAQRFKLSDLGSAAALKSLSKGAGGMPVVALGTLRSRVGDIISLRCKLVETEGEGTLATVGGTARITESEWAMFGHSAIVQPEAQPAPRPGVQAIPVSTRVVRELDQAATGPHPLKQLNCPFGVRIMVGGKLRQGVFRGNDYLVPLRPGEVYQIEVENRTGKLAAMRLLVDGLNTLPEKNQEKSVMTYEVAKRVNLEEARHWVLDPQKARVNAILGFVSETGVRGKLREFKIVDADKSLAARQNFTDQVGLITAAFYEPESGHRGGSVGTDFGDEKTADLTERQGVGVGSMICTINIRYVAPEELQPGR